MRREIFYASTREILTVGTDIKPAAKLELYSVTHLLFISLVESSDVSSH